MALKNWIQSIKKTFKRSNASSDAKAELKRARRVRLLSEDKISFIPDDRNIAEKLSVVNLSVSGVGFAKNSLPEWPEMDTVISGVFKISGESVPARVRLIQEFGSVMGGAFEGGLHELQRMLMKFFEVELAALTMIEVNPQVLQAPERGKARWFRGEDNCELYIEYEAEDQLLKYSVSFFGNFLEGVPGGVVKYGHIVRPEDEGKRRHKSSDIIRWDSDLPNGVLQAAMKLTENVNQLPFQLRVKIIDNLKSALK